ncbi:GNAT family N-acetyltransferase [Aneurinibacillus sp. Ricciae_BoGa-3]|uniref:GNAT family N-acetyltransferase n=1 Tax=Aneurinibacillus sp. Ricciae_BoGa-3 TaxID=3022697 RepID=UPI00233FE5FE|nr:GNAT family N-acetyltransferase [Aneurinibacillus sp. Ricciae_BoGa-3]WCK54049.1 GNAT family N-acetyltransferase [Aneurinibacillus sp. Ricciae_BoGa-3]
MIEIVELNQKLDLFNQAVELFWEQWGNPKNYEFYHDCIRHSCQSDSDLPRFYIAVQNNSIIGTYALLRNDLISRQDLFPWLACLYIIPELRGNKLGSLMLEHAVQQATEKGFKNLYLCTDLDGFYEKYNWSYLSSGYIFNGDPTKIYVRQTNQ